jgi:FkbM family methyltransferase
MSPTNPIARATQRLRRDAWRMMGVDALTGCRIRSVGTRRLGSKYGGWIIPERVLDATSVCYCAGAGEDISFDLALIEQYGCEVHTFDPTPRAIEHVERTAGNVPRLRFHPIGLWDCDEVLRFYAPADPTHVSHSVMNLQNTRSYFEARCRSLAHITQDLGHAHIDLLKLDIEGAEHRVIASMLAGNLLVRVLCVEFDEAVAGLTAEGRKRILATAQALTARGYVLAAQEGRSNYTFVRP